MLALYHGWRPHQDLKAEGGYNGAVLPSNDSELLDEMGHMVGEVGPGQCFGERSDKGGRREYSVVAGKGAMVEVLRIKISCTTRLVAFLFVVRGGMWCLS